MFKHLLFILLSISFLSACGGGSGTGSSGTGAVSFDVKWDQQSAKSVKSAIRASSDVCSDYGIETVNANVLNSSSSSVASNSWSCSAHGGTISNVPVGSGYTARLEGLDSGGAVTWRGEITGITVSSGATSSAGTITMTYIGSDTTPPYIISFNPSENATDVPVTTAITATFNENIASSTINTDTFTLFDSSANSYVSGSVSYDSSTKTATFTPASNLSYSTTYTATVSTGVTDMAGNAMAAAYTWTFTTSAGTSGSLDTTFDSTGKVITAIGANDDVASAVAIQSDGKIVAAGYSNTTSNGLNDFALVRYNTDGSLDSTFNSTGKVTTAIGTDYDEASAVAIQSDGKIVAAGYSNNDFALVRYNTDGSLDSTFNSTGKVTTAIGTDNDVASAVAIQSDGKIVAAGYSYNGSSNDFAVVRYNTDGSLDSTFGTGGKVTTAIGSSSDDAYALGIQSDGKIVAAGYSYNGSSNDFAVVRYNTDGSLDTTFNSTGKVTTATGTDNRGK